MSSLAVLFLRLSSALWPIILSIYPSKEDDTHSESSKPLSQMFLRDIPYPDGINTLHATNEFHSERVPKIGALDEYSFHHQHLGRLLL